MRLDDFTRRELAGLCGQSTILAPAQVLFISENQSWHKSEEGKPFQQIKRQPVHYRELFVSFHSAAPLSFMFLYFTARSSSRPRVNSGSIISSINFHPPKAATESVECVAGTYFSCQMLHWLK
jgi:hypothetical protein